MTQSSDSLRVLTVCAALGSGVIGGVFFAFSTFVMDALGRLAPPDGIRAMQSINVAVINPVFLGVFLGTTLVCIALVALTVRSWSDSGSALRLAGCVVYVAGAFAVTMICNVPRNDALAALSADTVEAATSWTRYVSEWTWWNHVRALAGVVASVLLVAAQLVGRGAQPD